MSDITKKFELFNSDEQRDFLDGLKTYLGYEKEIKETRIAQREQIKVVAGKIPDISKKDIRKLFVYFKKKITPDELREDADAIQSIQESMDDVIRQTE